MLRPSFRNPLLGVSLFLAACGGSSVKHGRTTGPSDGAAGDPNDTPQAGAGGTTSVGGGGGIATAGGTGGSGAATGATGGGGIATGATGGAPAGGTGGVSAGAAGGSSAGAAGEGLAPGCAPEDLASCDPGANQVCTSDWCGPGDVSTFGVDERGDGVLCKFLPDAEGPDFACLEGEWCQFELKQCRCGRHPGCANGERCVPSVNGADDFACEHAIACNDDSLETCAPGPGRACAAGELACTPALACPSTDAPAGAIRCDAAPDGCCAPGHWCFDERECRCGASAACSADELCALDDIGFYACRPR